MKAVLTLITFFALGFYRPADAKSQHHQVKTNTETMIKSKIEDI